MVLVAGLALSPACSDETTPKQDGPVGSDATVDTGSAREAAAPDLASPEAGSPEASVPDSATADAATVDAASPDAASPDAARPDASAPDRSLVDAPIPDAPPSCIPSKINFTQANTSKYELYELCFPSGDTTTEAAVKKLDSGLTCRHSGGGIAAKCTTSQWRCMGGLNRNPTKDITTAHWKVICSISAIKAVAKIVGGYYIH